MQYIIKSKYLERHGKKKVFQGVVLSLLIIILAVVAFGSGMYLSSKDRVLSSFADQNAIYLGKVLNKYNGDSEGRLSKDLDFDLFWQVWDELRSQYVYRDKLSDKKMFYGAIEGMVASARDPYTIFMDPELASEFESDLSGTFEGIGAEIGMRNDILTIISPLDDMPAQKAGLKAGDQIYEINGSSTMGISVDQAVKIIRGPKNSQVKLTIFRDGFELPRDFEITRGIITVKSVRTEMRADGIYVLRITNFNEDTDKLFNEAVDDILIKKPKAVILDLRNNPGGFLDTAIEVSSEWIEDGTVVSEELADGSREDYTARGIARLSDVRTIVLINGGSASASEIVAGALHDMDKATLVGEKSFGKGSVQAVTSLDDGSILKVTVAKWLTPNGTSINDEGISPNEAVELTTEDWNTGKDPQMDKAVELLK